jgi:hypothetical protein
VIPKRLYSEVRGTESVKDWIAFLWLNGLKRIEGGGG